MYNFSAPFVSAFRRLVNFLKSADRIIPYFPFANPYKRPDQKSYVGCGKPVCSTEKPAPTHDELFLGYPTLEYSLSSIHRDKQFAEWERKNFPPKQFAEWDGEATPNETKEETKRLTEEAVSPSRQEAVEKWVAESLKPEFVPLSFCDKKWPEILPFPANKHDDFVVANSLFAQCFKLPSEAGRGQPYWDRFFLGLARYVSTASKDPSTKVGAVIVDADRRVISVGYNGFAKDVDDSPKRYADRDFKIEAIVHAETNAILFAQRPLKNCVLYTWPFMSCAKCAGLVINAGITRCVAPTPTEAIKERWGKQMEISKQMFCEAGVKLDELEFE